MAILVNDIKIYQAQDNTDNDSGGGSRTSSEIVDGDVNNLFPDISRVDTVSGDVALRKIFPAVVTTNRDIYYGAHAIIRKNPTDPNVSSLLFYTDDPHDRRIEAQNKIESYVIASYEEEFYLFGNHIAGAKTVTFLMLSNSSPPVVGEVYMIRDPDMTEQYIRIRTVESQDVVLSYTTGNTTSQYIRKRVICEIEQPLEKAFIGSSFKPSGRESGAAITFATQVADAAKFYGTKTLAVDVNAGETTITVDDIYEQIVPASVTQTPIVNESAVTGSVSLMPTGFNRSLSLSGVNTSAGASFNVGSSIVPGSITRISSTYGYDDGKGNYIKTSDGTTYANINYVTGEVNIVLWPGTGGSIDYEVAQAFDTSIEFTEGEKVTQGTQNLVYVKNLSPMPSQSNLYIDYRSNGKWYRIQSNADGTLGSDPSIGAGNINDNGDGTGTVSLTLGSLPDIDSTIIYSWSSADRFTVHTETRVVNSQTVKIPNLTSYYLMIDLGVGNIDPSTFVMQLYDVNVGAHVNITSDAEGVLIDSADPARKIEGVLDFVSGKVYIDKASHSDRFPDLGATNQDVIIDFSTVDTSPGDPHEIVLKTGSKTPTAGQVSVAENTANGTVSFNIGESITDLSSFVVSLNVIPSEYNNWGGVVPSYRDIKKELLLRSDSSGNLKLIGTNSWGDVTGTIATNGNVTINLIMNSHKEPNPLYAGSFGTEPKYITVVDGYYTISDFDLSFKYRTDSPLGGVTRTPHPQITGTAESLFSYVINCVGGIAGEVDFYFLKANTTEELYHFYSESGNIYHNYSPVSGVGVNAGVIDYNSGKITINYLLKPETLYLNFNAITTDEVELVQYETGKYTEPFRKVVFRTASTKLSNGSFQLRYESESGQQTASSDQSGVITGTDINSATSYVDSKTGMASIEFTSDVLARSIRYDAVAESSLPLDPELLGLNPVRLPIDGRVPVIKPGDHLVIFNEVTTPVTNGTPVADQVETLARSGQAFIEVIDADGKRLDPNEYVADKTAGTVTFGNPLNLVDKYGASLNGPFSIVDRIEDMLLATDVQINGLVSLSAPLSNNYTKDNTYVASALVWGDTGARVYNYFSEEIWNSGNPVWSDTIVGDPTTAQYDLINYPIQIDNKSSASGRWAIIFTSSTTVDVVEEKLGVVQSGISISVDDVAPINPATGLPYFIMDKAGFGSGWVTNNFIRINTDSGDNNAWVIRTVKSGALIESTDSIVLEVRGDAN